MVTRRVVLLALALLAARGLAAQRSGLLLGVSGDSGYRTLWIAPVEGKFVARPVAPTLIVPRQDGFHRLDVLRWCEVLPSAEGPYAGPWRNEFDEVTDQKVGAPPPTPDSGSTSMDCDAAARIVAAGRDSIARADSIGLRAAKTAEDSAEHLHDLPGGEEGDVCYSRTVGITYASPRYWSIVSGDGSGENCNPGRETWSTERHTVGVDSGAGESSLLKHLTPARARAVTRVWEREKGSCAHEQGPDDSWGIVRALGEWRAAFATSGATACAGQSGNEESGFSIVQRVPPPFARRDPIDHWLPQLTAAAATLTDAFASPGGDVVIGRAGGRLLVFVPRDGALGAPVLTVPLPARNNVVMAEWATGAFVDRWTRELSAVHERW